MPERFLVVLGALIAGTATALSLAYEDYEHLAEPLITIIAVAGFILTAYQILKKK